MAVTKTQKQWAGDLAQMSEIIPKIPGHRVIIDYDDGADVLYVSLARPQEATDSEMSEDGILYRYRGKELVGITIFDASKRRS